MDDDVYTRLLGDTTLRQLLLEIAPILYVTLAPPVCATTTASAPSRLRAR